VLLSTTADIAVMLGLPTTAALRMPPIKIR
jgi:hypothetical protein